MNNLKKLTRDEMKNVLGGVTAGTCTSSCNGYYGLKVYSKETAQQQADYNITSGICNTATWCCDSCP